MIVEFDQPFHSLSDYAAFQKSFHPSPYERYFKNGSSCIKINFDEFLITGGVSHVAGIKILNCATLISPTKFQDITSLAIERAYHTSVRLKTGDILVLGGMNIASDETEKSCEIFDVKKGKWESRGEMLSKRCFGHGACLLQNGSLIVTGGMNFDPDRLTLALQSSEYFNPATMEFTPAPPLPYAVHHHAVTLLENGVEVLISGGGTEM